MPLSPTELVRYSRHLSLPHVGPEGQEKLKNASVVIIGAGGLGSPAALYLGAAGVGRLGIVDADDVDLTNLHRQVLHGTSDVGRSKTGSAAERLRNLNPEIEIVTHRARLSSANALEILKAYDVVVDGSDNFPTRYLVNDACVMLGKPDVYGSIFRFEGQASVFWAGQGPCYRCLYPEPPPPGLVPSCEEGGVLGVLPGLVGVVQATEAVKLILQIGRSLIGRLLMFDALAMSFREVSLKKSLECRVCGPKPEVTELIDYEAFCGVKSPGAEAPPGREWTITPAELAQRIDRGDAVRLIDVRERHEWAMGHIAGAELIPLSTIPREAHRLDPSEEIVLYCRSGARSGNALEILRDSGFERLRNLVGGFDRWAREVGRIARPER